MTLRIFAVATVSTAAPVLLCSWLARSDDSQYAIVEAARVSGVVDLALPTGAREIRNPLLSAAHADLSESPGVAATDSLQIWIRRPQ